MLPHFVREINYKHRSASCMDIDTISMYTRSREAHACFCGPQVHTKVPEGRRTIITSRRPYPKRMHSFQFTVLLYMRRHNKWTLPDDACDFRNYFSQLFPQSGCPGWFDNEYIIIPIYDHQQHSK